MISEILYSKITDTIGESQIQGEKGNILVDMISRTFQDHSEAQESKGAGIQIDEGSESPL